MSDFNIKAAQHRLDKLCEEHGVEKFNIEGAVGLVCWRKLVQAMCGIDINYREESGRKANPDKLVDDVRRLYALYMDFSRLEISNDTDKTKETTYRQLPDFLKKQIYGFIADSLSKSYGEEITSGRVRGILNNKHNKEQLERLQREEFKELEVSSFDPDDMSESE